MDAILVSLNGDFSDIVRYPPSRYKGIFALQVRNRPESIAHILAELTGYMARHPNPEHFYGRLFLVEAHRIRMRQ